MFTLAHPNTSSSRAVRDLLSLFDDDSVFSNCSSDVSREALLPLDILEDEDAVIVRASLPGFAREEIDISVHNGILSIKAEHRTEDETSKEKYYRRERRVQTVSRQVQLPGHVSDRDAEASLEDGVLTLRIPHAEEARPKRIDIR